MDIILLEESVGQLTNIVIHCAECKEVICKLPTATVTQLDNIKLTCRNRLCKTYKEF